jgi:hypothetical protein
VIAITEMRYWKSRKNNFSSWECSDIGNAAAATMGHGNSSISDFTLSHVFPPTKVWG